MNFDKKSILEGEILSGKDPNIHERGKQSANEKRVRKGFWRTFAKATAKAGSKIPFAEDIVASYYCALDPDTPGKVRAILFGGLAYFVLPLDAIPDFLLGFGFTDDMAVLAAMLSSIRSNIKDRHINLAREKLRQLDETDQDS
jgi:uncharacterized membrane protein YkvA (DUF1232 family)